MVSYVSKLMSAFQLRITGLVQGVFYRVEMKKMADLLGVTGWVRNTDDDAVEAHVEGDEGAVQELIDWCRKGPPLARVEKVEITDAATEEQEGFTILR